MSGTPQEAHPGNETTTHFEPTAAPAAAPADLARQFMASMRDAKLDLLGLTQSPGARRARSPEQAAINDALMHLGDAITMLTAAATLGAPPSLVQDLAVLALAKSYDCARALEAFDESAG